MGTKFHSFYFFLLKEQQTFIHPFFLILYQNSSTYLVRQYLLVKKIPIPMQTLKVNQQNRQKCTFECFPLKLAKHVIYKLCVPTNWEEVSSEVLAISQSTTLKRNPIITTVRRLFTVFMSLCSFRSKCINFVIVLTIDFHCESKFVYLFICLLSSHA